MDKFLATKVNPLTELFIGITGEARVNPLEQDDNLINTMGDDDLVLHTDQLNVSQATFTLPCKPSIPHYVYMTCAISQSSGCEL